MLYEDKPISDEELAHWLAFSVLSGVGPKRVAVLEERLNSMVTSWNAPVSVLRRLPGFGDETIAAIEAGRKEIDPHKLLANLKDTGIKAWTWNDPHYPIRLRHIADPPIVLYVNGDLRPEFLTSAVAVVGTRRPTSYGEKNAKAVALGLSTHGVTVVSGMAVGIDSIAHWGALDGGSPTIAVLGCGPDVCYPSSNKRLFKAILEEGKGAIISEYFPGTTAEKFRFPARNRIISGLCQALVVVEGACTSGSLISANMAFDQSREVFAFPGRIDAVMSEGPNKLIKQNKAHLCTSYEDILDELNWVKTKVGANREQPSVVALYGREREVYDLISLESIHFDAMVEQSGMSAGELSATLTMLELAGLVTREAGDWYSRQSDVTVRNR